ncbi:MAG: TetR/AcrR family transcriptional regulator, partial [Cyanobacteria bacterium P01_A01_bin.17]
CDKPCIVNWEAVRFKNSSAATSPEMANAFEQCILERGIEGTSFQHIAQVLGMDRKMVSHYFGNREALVDAMTEQIVEGFDLRISEALASLESSVSVMELVDAFYEQTNASEHTDILWTEICAYATRSETVRDRLRQSYNKMFQVVGEALEREYPHVSQEQAQTAAYAIATLLDRSPTFEWIGVKGEPMELARVAIKQVLEKLE